MSQPFWINDPTILLNKESLFELWPTKDMQMEEKLNAITRLILLMTLIGYAVTMSMRILLISFITIAIIIFLYKTKTNKQNVDEGFEVKKTKDGEKIINPETLETFMKSEFKMGTKKNPFSNVLLTDIMDEPERKSAPPAFNPNVDVDIIKDTKKMIQHLNPGIQNTNKQLFSSLTDNFDLDQSLRAFNSMPNTKITNDQTAFAEYLYGNMPSAKESTVDGNLQREKDSYRYTLY